MLSAVTVSTDADSGPGSFRAAVELANTDPGVTSIVFEARLNTVALRSRVEYTGAQALSIQGNTVNIQPTDEQITAIDLFISSGGADLSLSRVTFRRGAHGVVVDVPLSATGEVNVLLDKVTIADNELFGLHVIDLKEVPLPPEDPEAESTEIGSGAGVALRLIGSDITGNGVGAHDQDGIRVDERGDGGVRVRILDSRLNGNGAEGIELDEAGAGGVELDIRNSEFNANGFVSSGDPDDPDFDDGIDIDEADAGSVVAVVVNATFSGNFDEGIDLNEDGDGDLGVVLVGVRADNNTDEGIALEEAGDGGIRATLVRVEASRNGADGAQFEEFDAGDLAVDIAFSQLDGNGGYGVFASQSQPGNGLLWLRNVTLRRNGAGPFNTTIENEETGDEEDSGVLIRTV